MKLKINKYYILGLSIIILIIGISFWQYYQNNFAYEKDYYIIKEKCYNEKDKKSDYCSIFKDKQQIKNYIKNSDPKENFKKHDAITMTCEIIELSFFNNLQLFSPLIVIIIVVGTFHDEFTSGNFENYLLRMNYKKYLKRTYKVALKSALIIPISLFMVFSISMLITHFNFNINPETLNNAVYNSWKYSHFLVYGMFVCLIQYFISLVYANFALICCVKNKNSLITIIMSYIMFIAFYLFVYIVLYSLIINKFLGFKEMTEYFNVAGYWFFYSFNECIGVLLLSILFQILSTIFVFSVLKNKEKVVQMYEKQLS